MGLRFSTVSWWFRTQIRWHSMTTHQTHLYLYNSLLMNKESYLERENSPQCTLSHVPSNLPWGWWAPFLSDCVEKIIKSSSTILPGKGYPLICHVSCLNEVLYWCQQQSQLHMTSQWPNSSHIKDKSSYQHHCIPHSDSQTQYRLTHESVEYSVWPLEVDHCCSVTKYCLTFWDSMDCSTPASSVSLSPDVCSNLCPLSQWCYLIISFCLA